MQTYTPPKEEEKPNFPQDGLFNENNIL